MRYFLVLILALFLVSTSNAQVSFGISFNLQSQPAWGPTGYDRVQYYYLPDLEAYYNVPQSLFYFNINGRWVGRSSLPSRYRDYDLYRSYKVVVNEKQPWRNHNNYREKYSTYKGRRDQEPIRDSKDSKYFVNKHHPEHNNWVKQQKKDKRNEKAAKRNNNNGNKKGKGRNK